MLRATKVAHCALPQVRFLLRQVPSDGYRSPSRRARRTRQAFAGLFRESHTAAVQPKCRRLLRRIEHDGWNVIGAGIDFVDRPIQRNAEMLDDDVENLLHGVTCPGGDVEDSGRRVSLIARSTIARKSYMSRKSRTVREQKHFWPAFSRL